MHGPLVIDAADGPVQVGGPAQRRVLAPGGYLIDLDPDAVDVLRFERLAAQGRAALAAGAAGASAAALREALALWRGDAYVDLRGWGYAEQEAERLETLRLDAIEDRIAADLALGAGPSLVSELQALAAANPLRERLAAQTSG